jgi:cytochrome b involved in lipid metabolism
MGWLKPTAFFSQRESHEDARNDRSYGSRKDILLKADSTAEHRENVEEIHSVDNSSQHLSHPFQRIELEDSELPFIPDTIVRSAKKDLGRTWIVVDNVIYDCTEFISEHPGGETVIDSFAGQDCSWQFWRFHNATHVRDSGRPLRVGRTAGVKNRFAERPRFVGLRKKDDWW